MLSCSLAGSPAWAWLGNSCWGQTHLVSSWEMELHFLSKGLKPMISLTGIEANNHRHLRDPCCKVTLLYGESKWWQIITLGAIGGYLQYGRHRAMQFTHVLWSLLFTIYKPATATELGAHHPYSRGRSHHLCLPMRRLKLFNSFTIVHRIKEPHFKTNYLWMEWDIRLSLILLL